MNQNETSKVIFETRSARYKAGVIKLNSVKNLNALSTEMYELMLSQLAVWDKDKSVDFLWIESNSEKAFSAGGDVKSLALGLQQGDLKSAHRFFTKEYLLDYRLSQFSKPTVVFGSGLVIGGGWGLFNACRFKIATEISSFCMPEITIGLFPDVGASYFLNQLPGSLGLFLGLTAGRLSAGDAVKFGVADLMVDSKKSNLVLDYLLESGISNELTSCDFKKRLLGQSLDCNKHLSSMSKSLELLNKGFKSDSFDDVYESLLVLQKNKLLATQISKFFEGSPVSQRLIYELLKNYKSTTLKEALVKEHALALHFMTGVNFREGVRALLIDKDGAPKWSNEKQGYFEQAINCLESDNSFAGVLID